ncbi:MAG: outer membrane beta-barrel protein [Betaproteobacteria bacterium]|nr:outer membrane beta-barrel protein [Betaproteobacteria bacterium]MCC6250096.1 outer membrane beta-barrel protein [Rubrivivax sp.]MCL4699530.1 outer membrane beta-barrel protein [Burkholderiaceae bacterium]
MSPTFARHAASAAVAAVMLAAAAAAQAQAPAPAPAAPAAPIEHPRVYIGLTAGVAAAVAKNHDTDKHETGSGRPSAGVYVGLRLLDVPVGRGLPLGLEAGYQDIASHTIPYRVNGSTTDLTARGHASYLALRLAVPLSERVALYGRLGASRNVVDSITPAGQTPIDIDGRKTDVMSGFGAEFTLMPNLLLRVEATRYGRVSEHGRVGAVNAGIAVGF